MRIVDAWMQHPTRRFLEQPFFESLRRWARQDRVPDVPVSQTIEAMDEAGVEVGLTAAWWGPQGALIDNDEVTSFVRALAVELARHRIRVNSILPGWIVTEMTECSVASEKFTRAVMPRIPARRWGEIDDFGGIAVYLASDASAYTTGEQFVIDGGYTKF